MNDPQLFADEARQGDRRATSTRGGFEVPVGMPLAARMRPRDLGEYVGQADALGEGKPLRAILDRGDVRSMILWGPPGVGKTSLAAVIAAHVDAVWTEVSAVSAGVKDVRRLVEEGRSRSELHGRRTVLFVDEIHRFNKGQQDALLPGVEAGWVSLIGATTENPFFELNAPLLSRCQLIRLEPLDDEAIRTLLQRALDDEQRGYGGRLTLDAAAMDHLVAVGDGDARAALSAMEIAAVAVGIDTPRAAGDARGAVVAGATAGGVDESSTGATAHLDLDAVADAMKRLRYDKTGDGHHDQVSAFIKSMRGSDPDAALYWMFRMLEAGEDPRFLARRMVIFASEDVGLADRQALPTAVAAFHALEFVGLPEARYALAHATIALATAPKSNSVTRAIAATLDAVQREGNAAVPAHLRDSHYRGARQLGHGVGYDYPHDHASGYAPAQQHLPDELRGAEFFSPGRHGHEAPVADRVADLRAQARATRAGGSEQPSTTGPDQRRASPSDPREPRSPQEGTP